MKNRISRRGFRNAPTNVTDVATRYVNETIEAAPAALQVDVLAELRRTVYCGPGSAGDRGAWTLSITVDGWNYHDFRLRSIEV